MSYHHLTIEERACIAVYYKKNLSVTEVSRLLGRNKATISREFSRNPSQDEGYNAIGAQRKYNARRRKCVRPKVLQTNEELFEKVCEGLNNYCSPEQISNTLPIGLHVCFSTIYRAIKSKVIPEECRVKLRRYGKMLKHQKSARKAYDFSEVRTISERPKSVESREKPGHWELDTVVLRPECHCHLATFVERKERCVLIRKIPDKKAVTMGNAIIDAFRTLPSKMLKTLTVDRGLEFTDWKRVEKELGVKVYFCDPYSPFQRGTNENTNGLIRQFFPRGAILPGITDELVANVQTLINNRPRKCLNWRSPASLHLY